MLLMTYAGCQWNSRTHEDDNAEHGTTIERFDRIESLYLTLGDFAALQQMTTSYPVETRMLIEDVLHLGRVDDTDIKVKFLMFFQDSTLQALIADVKKQYDQMDDVDHALTHSFIRLQEMIPGLELPHVYTQIGSLDQSIIVGNGMLGISLDKYLGADHPFYLRYGYSPQQRSMMTREYIVPDCLGFYLLSLYPAPRDTMTTHEQRDLHMGRIQYVVNRAMDQQFFTNEHVKQAEQFLAKHHDMSLDVFLRHQE